MEKSKEYTTGSRTKILAYLQQNKNRSVNVNDIANYLASQNSAVNITTVYRYLDKLVSQGVLIKYVAEKGSMATYQYVEKGKHCKEHLHLRCMKCGAVIHLECDFMSEISQHILKEHGFLLSCEHSVMCGLCQNCRTEKM